MQSRVVFLCLGLGVAAAGCAKVKAAVCTDMVPATKAELANAAGKLPTGKAEKEAKPEEPPDAAGAAPNETGLPEAAGPQDAFALPFAWEKSPNEPLSRTRAYLRDMARDNAAYMRRNADSFKAYANAESPRATVLSCADSRVQSAAFDASAENDDYTVRNLGNQLGTSLGAVQYGVDHLHTPLLIVLGHTGCTAVKAAMTTTAKLSEPIKKELASIKLPVHKGKKPLDDKQWRDGVVKNVNDQVESALSTFAARVTAGELTVIGAVYDMRNDLDKGAGRVSIINVNGITEAGRLKAFHEAVLAGANLDSGGTKPMDPFERLSQVFSEHMHDDDEDGDDAHSGIESVPIPVAPMQHAPGQIAPARPAPGAMPAKQAVPHH